MTETLRPIDGAGPEVYRYPDIDRHGFVTFVTGRGGGVSAAPYGTLNAGGHVGDDEAAVAENLRRIKDAVNAPSLWTARQVHGDGIAVIDKSPPPPSMEADAVVVSAPGVAVGVLTADCMPVILADPVHKVAAAVHAGRKGAELNVAGKTVDLMARRFGADPLDVRAALGPCIRRCCYGVDEDTARVFESCCGAERLTTGGDWAYLDIAGAVWDGLRAAGLAAENIFDSGVCTSCENARFFSYRKDGNVTGRFISAVAIGQ